MLGLVRCAVVSAVLSAGVVGAIQPPAKPYLDRLPASGEEPARAATSGTAAFHAASAATHGRGPKGDRLAGPGCDEAAWPYIPAGCVEGAGTRPVRVITVERRPAPGVSVLERAPAPSLVAERR